MTKILGFFDGNQVFKSAAHPGGKALCPVPLSLQKTFEKQESFLDQRLDLFNALREKSSPDLYMTERGFIAEKNVRLSLLSSIKDLPVHHIHAESGKNHEEFIKCNSDFYGRGSQKKRKHTAQLNQFYKNCSHYFIQENDSVNHYAILAMRDNMTDIFMLCDAQEAFKFYLCEREKFLLEQEKQHHVKTALPRPGKRLRIIRLSELR